MIQGSFPINLENPLLEDIQEMVQAFLYKGEHGSIQQFNLANAKSTDLAEENVPSSRGLANQNHLQLDEKPAWQLIQEKQNKITAWKSRFHEVKEACHQRGISLNRSRENTLEVKLVDIIDTGTTDFKLVDDLDGELTVVEARDFSENEQVDLAAMQNILEPSQRATQALLNTEQQCQEWGLLSDEVSCLNQEAQNFQSVLVSSAQQIDVLERDVTFHREQLLGLQDMHELEDRFEAFEDGLSRIESQQHEDREQLLKIDILEERIRRDEEAARADLNHVSTHLVLDSLKNKLIEMSSNVGSTVKEMIHGTVSTFQETQESISTFKEQVKELPSLIRDTIKESIRNASAFLWENFTNLGWNTIEAISNIGKSILQHTQVTYSCFVRNVSVVFDRTNLSLIALSILSGCVYVMTGTLFAFGAVAIAGYLFVRSVL